MVLHFIYSRPPQSCKKCSRTKPAETPTPAEKVSHLSMPLFSDLDLGVFTYYGLKF